MHGRRRGTVYWACPVKTAYSTYKAAAKAAAKVRAVRVYRGPCCGYYHITSMTIDEFAQQQAALCTNTEIHGTVQP